MMKVIGATVSVHKRVNNYLRVEGTGYHDGINRVIQANLQLFKEKDPEVQFFLTRAILAQEVGRGLFTAGLVRNGRQTLAEMFNFLKDEYFERAMSM